MHLIKYNLIPFLWIIFKILSIVNANTINISDSESFESELTKCKENEIGKAKLIITKNITLTHQIKIKCQKKVNIDIEGENKNIHINQKFYNRNNNNNNNYMMILNKFDEINIKNIKFDGNVYYNNIKNLSIDSLFITGNIYIKDSSISLNGVNIVSKDYKTEPVALKLINSKGSISNLNINASSEINYAIYTEDSSIKFYTINLTGSLDKIVHKEPNLHRCVSFIRSVNEIWNATIWNFGDFNTYHGYMINLMNSKCIIKNCTIHDGYSSSDPIYVDETSVLMISNSKIYNIYSNTTIATVRNIGVTDINGLEIYNDLNTNYYLDLPIWKISASLGSYQSANMTVSNLYAHDLKVNSVLFLLDYASITALNVTIENIELYRYGAPFSTYNTKKGIFQLENITIKNIIQRGEIECGIFFWQTSTTAVTVKNATVDFGMAESRKSMVIYYDASDKSEMNLTNVEFRNIHINDNIIEFRKGNSLSLNNVKFINCSTDTAILRVKRYGENISLKDIYVENFNNDISYDNITSSIEQISSTFMDRENTKSIDITNITMKNSTFYELFHQNAAINVLIKNGNFENNIFYNSAINIITNFNSKFMIENTIFKSNVAKDGTIISNKDVYNNNNKYSYFKNCTFENNIAKNRGGIIYSIGDSSELIFRNCKFINNSATIGSISYSRTKDYEPKFIPDIYSSSDNVLLNGKSYGGPFVTNPTKVICQDLNKYSFYSGESIDSISYELIFFQVTASSVESNSNSHIKLKGKTQSFCWNDSCSLNDISIIADKGTYNIIFEIIKYGNLNQFNSKKNFTITVNKCPVNEDDYLKSKYYVKNIDDDNIKSCILKKCDYDCKNDGICIEKNKCQCRIGWKGDLCQIHPSYTTILILRHIYFFFGLIELILVLILIYITIYFKNLKEVKLAKPFFMLSILLGIVLELCIIFLVYFTPSKNLCLTILWFRYMGNAFIYGSILVKCYQISNIYNTRKFKVISNRKARVFYFIIVIIHFAILIIWTFIDNKDYVDHSYTKDGEEYLYCKNRVTSFIGNIISLIFIIVGFNEIYITRYIPKNFKEPLGVPMYIYTFFILTDMFVTYYSKNLSPDTIKSLQCISTLIFCPVIVYNLNYKKLNGVINYCYSVITNDYENNGNERVKQNMEITNNIYKSKVIENNRYSVISSINWA
ncbi:hypothetical protein BCR32DRAFT_268045 [Anaeromyces robustus]|uniref:G-protein coupled receptors family 3 profile domain-containing protein n=1 Tax=Anaeromyces robustus TaxID=1754192 RepID=A0A1Y1X7T8_9FUNG|nr:hypothetical protein BCR32DRAFT_268045 [Anaeromyces robustus]|eukprot:ORX81822.1 hypothetical protein BCR32DRAFT_268045 [Anaeromyces robustus]